MRLSLTPTDRIVGVDLPICRIWKGKTERGTEVYAYVVAIAVRADCNDDEMEELREIPEMEDPFLEDSNG